MDYTFAGKMKAMSYFKEQDLLSLGFSSGRVESYFVSIEFEKEELDEDEDEEFKGEIKNYADGTIIMNKVFK
jgi:hypothetical protein